MRFVIFLIISSLQMSFAGTQKILGTYTPEQLKSLKVGCLKSDMSTITLVSENSKSCKNPFYIKNFVIQYSSGIRQEFNYSQEALGTAGAPLHVSQFRILPDTKCLNQISAQLTRSTLAGCKDPSRIKVIVTQ